MWNGTYVVGTLGRFPVSHKIDHPFYRLFFLIIYHGDLHTYVLRINLTLPREYIYLSTLQIAHSFLSFPYTIQS